MTAAGASLTGSGDFTFDNTDLMTWGGMPAPGAITVWEAGKAGCRLPGFWTYMP